MNKITVELDDGTEVVYGKLDSVVIRQNRPADIQRDGAGFIKKIRPGRITTLTIVGMSERRVG